jgi:polysaccharide export outer membrane protein
MFNTAMRYHKNKYLLSGVALRRLAAILVLFFFGCSTAGLSKPITVTQENPLPADEQAFALGAGDVITVKVFRHDDLSLTNLKVRMDGTISIPLAGQIKVTDMPVREAEKLLEEKLAYYVINPTVSINSVTISSQKIFVLGEVTNQTVVTLEESTTMLQAIAKAGGVTENAKTSEVALIRGGQVYYVDINRALKGDMTQNVILKAGDTIYVQPTFISDLSKYFAAVGKVMGFLISIESSIILTKQVTDIFTNKSSGLNSPSLSIPTK